MLGCRTENWSAFKACISMISRLSLCPHVFQTHVPCFQFRSQLSPSDRTNVLMPDSPSHLSPGGIDITWTQTELPNLLWVPQGPNVKTGKLFFSYFSGCSYMLLSIGLNVNMFLFVFHNSFSFCEVPFIIWPNVASFWEISLLFSDLF